MCQGEKVDKLTKEAKEEKNLESKPKQIRSEKGLFLGNPVIQAVEAKMLGYFYKKFIVLKNTL